MMRYGSVSLAVIAFATLAPAAQIARAQPAGIEALLEQARYWQARGRADRAREAYLRVLALDPDNAEARRAVSRSETRAPAASTEAPYAAASRTDDRRSGPSVRRNAPTAGGTARSSSYADARAAGFRQLEAGDLEAAARSFNTALSGGRNDGQAAGGLGIVRLRQDRFAEARDLLERASRLTGPDQWREALSSARYYAALNEARSLLRDGDTARAEGVAANLVRSGEGDPVAAQTLLAEVYEAQGRYGDAADVLDQAGEAPGEEQNRLRSRAARNRALDARASGADGVAEREFLAGIMLDPTDPWLRYEFARFMDARGRVAEVESTLDRLSSQGDPQSLYAAALLYDEFGNRDAAQRIIDRIAQRDRSAFMSGFAQRLAYSRRLDDVRMAMDRGQRREAIALLRGVTASGNVPASAQAEAAGLALELGDVDGAVDAARRALDGPLTAAGSYEPVVRAFARAGLLSDVQQAVQAASRVADNTPSGRAMIERLNAIAAASRADMMREQGRFADAFDTLQSAWQSAPDDSEILFQLGLLYQTGGMPARAAQTYQIVLNTESDNERAMLGLIRTAAEAGDAALSDGAFDAARRSSPDSYEVYLAAADAQQALGNDGRARRYLLDARALYEAQTGYGSTALASGNPFDGGMANNPFRNAAPAPEPVRINPFALGDDTRIPDRSVRRADNARTGGFGARGAGYAPGASGYSPPPRRQGAILRKHRSVIHQPEGLRRQPFPPRARNHPIAAAIPFWRPSIRGSTRFHRVAGRAVMSMRFIVRVRARRG